MREILPWKDVNKMKSCLCKQEIHKAYLKLYSLFKMFSERRTAICNVYKLLNQYNEEVYKQHKFVFG